MLIVALRIRHLRVQDFRAFRGTHEFAFEADPDQHLELISGPNASGKSTFIEALQLCFYGEADRDGFHSYVNQQVVDHLDVDERATANIAVELVDSRTEETIRITRDVSTMKTPQGRTDVVDDPVIERHSGDGEWTKVSEPSAYLEELIPSETQPFSFYDPEQILGLDTWEEGESFDELVDRMRKLRNRAAHAQGMPESAAIDVSGEYLEALNRNLAMVDDAVEVDRAEEYLVIGSRQDDGPLLSKGTQILISFALTLAAGELEGVETPLVMDMPFTRVDEETFETMCQLLQQASDRQTIIVGFPNRVDQVAENLSEVVASYHRLAAEEMESISVNRIQ
jgi:DNA repair exonuclease SbcCD ATPase subunit